MWTRYPRNLGPALRTNDFMNDRSERPTQRSGTVTNFRTLATNTLREDGGDSKATACVKLPFFYRHAISMFRQNSPEAACDRAKRGGHSHYFRHFTDKLIQWN